MTAGGFSISFRCHYLYNYAVHLSKPTLELHVVCFECSSSQFQTPHWTHLELILIIRNLFLLFILLTNFLLIIYYFEQYILLCIFHPFLHPFGYRVLWGAIHIYTKYQCCVWFAFKSGVDVTIVKWKTTRDHPTPPHIYMTVVCSDIAPL
jgi:hypothetical protein